MLMQMQRELVASRILKKKKKIFMNIFFVNLLIHFIGL